MSARDESEPTARLEIQHSDGRRQMGAEHRGGEIVLPFVDGTVDECGISFSLRLFITVGTSEHWRINIEGQFNLEDSSGPPEWIQIHEGTTPGDVNRPVNSLLHRKVERATVGTDGALRLEFDEGVAVEVAPGEHYEAWQVVGPKNAVWVGGPSASVSVFEPLS